jgi:hypothetical protein
MNIDSTLPIWASVTFFKILPNFVVSKLDVIQNSVMKILKGNFDICLIMTSEVVCGSDGTVSGTLNLGNRRR